jgi:DNA-binding response OmpR family regulator
MDAFAFRERQRQLGVAATAHTIVVSAARDLESAAERLNADSWIAKPFRLDEVVDATALLGRRVDHHPLASSIGPWAR